MMWYGEEYFQYVDKVKLATFKNCDETRNLSGSAIRIRLYNDPLEYNKEENRRRQWAFREYVGIDDAAEKLRLVKRFIE
ncbi:hypothetical protein D3C84_940960 [compost metagenome]